MAKSNSKAKQLKRGKLGKAQLSKALNAPLNTTVNMGPSAGYIGPPQPDPGV